jgi:hypothetical protein
VEELVAARETPPCLRHSLQHFIGFFGRAPPSNKSLVPTVCNLIVEFLGTAIFAAGGSANHLSPAISKLATGANYTTASRQSRDRASHNNNRLGKSTED